MLEANGLAAPVNVTASFIDEAQLVTRTDKFLRAFSDEAIALDRYFRAIKELGGSVTANPISAFRRYFGKIAERGDEIEKRFKQPIMDIVKKSNITPDAAGQYVEARHIPEANESFHQQYLRRKRMQEELKVLRKRDTEADRSEDVARRIRGLERDVKKLDHLPKRLPDGVTPEQFFHEVNPLSGMKTSEARAIQQKADAESPGYHEIGKLIDSLNRYTRDRMLADQLITQEQYDEWSAQFKHYVPLRTAEVDKPEGPRSSGMSVRGPESKRRKGRKSRADNPLIMSIVQALNAAQRGEKNAVGLEFREFLNSNKGLLESVEAEKEITYDEKTGKPNNIEPKEFHVKVGGRDTVIKIDNQDVVDALKRVGLANLQSVPGFVKTTMRVWRAMVTTASPEFGVSNFLRDIMSAMINASDVIDEYKLEGVRSATFLGVRKAAATVWNQQRETGRKTGLEQRYEEYRKNGGAIGTFTSPNFQEQLQRVEREFKRTQRPAIVRAPLDTAAGAWDVVEDWNQAIETSTRFSFYNALRDRGVSAKDAALAARQLTVDFSQKGTLGSAISLVYAFFSASVGGTRRTLEALGRSKTARGITAAITAQGFVSAFVNEAISDEDDDGLTFYEKVPEWEKGKYMMFMVGDEPMKIIMPWGYSFFHNLGRLTAEGIQGKKSAGDVFQRLVVAAADNFNPIGTSPNLIHMATPTLAKPAVEIALNQNFAGNPIAPPENPFGPDMAAHRRRGSKTPEWAVSMAKAINSLTGGDDVRPGMVDLAGDHYEHIQEFVGGGTGRFVEKVVATLRAAGRGQFDPAATPFIRQVYGAQTEFTDQSNFYAALDELAYQDTALKDAKKARDVEAMKAVREKYAKTLRLKRRGDAVREKVSALRKEAFAGDAPDEAKLEEMNVLMKGFYRDYLIAIGKVRE